MQQTLVLLATETKVCADPKQFEGAEKKWWKKHVVIQRSGKSKNFRAGLDELECIFQHKWFYDSILRLYILSPWHWYPARMTEHGLRGRKPPLEEHKLDIDQSDASLFPFQSGQEEGQCLFSVT